MSTPLRARGACVLLGPPRWLGWPLEANRVRLLLPTPAMPRVVGPNRRRRPLGAAASVAPALAGDGVGR